MLTDEQILNVLRLRQPCPTYFVKNVLREAEPGLTTAAMRSRLTKMESAGSVARSPQWSTNSIYWVAAPKLGEQEGGKTNE